MKQPGRSATSAFAILALLALLALSACGGGLNKPRRFDLVEVNVTVRGAPLDAEGSLDLANVELTAYDHTGQQIAFDEHLSQSDAGPKHSVVLSPSNASVALYLIRNRRVDFRAVAHDAAGGTIAFGRAARTVIVGGNNAVVVPLTALLGGAKLAPRLPLHELVPGQILDVTLTVNPPAHPDLTVPIYDYDVAFEGENATILATSQRGVRLRAGARSGGDLNVSAEVSGLIPAPPHPVPGSLQADLTIPFSDGLTLDLDPPTVSSLAFDANQQIFTGIADDDLGVVVLEVFDGPVRLASTKVSSPPGPTIASVTFPGGGTAFITHLSLPSGPRSLTVIARDYTGNQAQATLHVVIP